MDWLKASATSLLMPPGQFVAMNLDSGAVESGRVF